MDSIRIQTSKKKLLINDGPDFIEFDPTDVLWVERLYSVYREFEVKQTEYETQAKKLDANKKVTDENGIPLNIEEGLGFLHEICDYMREKIDQLFGQGTSQVVFGDSLSMEAIGSFFQGITPFVEAVRVQRISRYSGKAKKKSSMH